MLPNQPQQSFNGSELDWDWVPPVPDPRGALEAELANLERRIEQGADEMNTLDGMDRLEWLEEERDGVLE